jgi:hypothetical protein
MNQHLEADSLEEVLGATGYSATLDTISIPAQVRVKKGKDLQAHYRSKAGTRAAVGAFDIQLESQDGRSGKFGLCSPLLNTKSSVLSQIRKR